MLKDILTNKKGLFETGVHTELRGQINRNRRVVLVNGDVMGNVRSEQSGVSARVYRGGVYGFSSMAEYTDEAAEMVLKAATENAASGSSILISRGWDMMVSEGWICTLSEVTYFPFLSMTTHQAV